jgi:hypothetical protein
MEVSFANCFGSLGALCLPSLLAISIKTGFLVGQSLKKQNKDITISFLIAWKQMANEYDIRSMHTHS